MEGVYRFEITLAGDYEQAYALFVETVKSATVIDPRPSSRWETIEHGKPVYYGEGVDDE